MYSLVTSIKIRKNKQDSSFITLLLHNQKKKNIPLQTSSINEFMSRYCKISYSARSEIKLPPTLNLCRNEGV